MTERINVPKEWEYIEFLEVVELLDSMSKAYSIYRSRFGEHTDDEETDRKRWGYIRDDLQ